MIAALIAYAVCVVSAFTALALGDVAAAGYFVLAAIGTMVVALLVDHYVGPDQGAAQ